MFSKYYGFIDNEDEDGDYQIYSDGSGYYHGSDGSKAQIYSDGSGYFHGADGSEAQIYPDGSGYYYGADGSEGHIYSDGTGRFRGADGSTGHRNSDGSGYFEDEYGDTVSYDSFSERENEYAASEEKDFVSDITEILLDAAFKAGAAAIKNGVAKAKEQARQEEAERLEAQREEEERAQEKYAEQQKKKARRKKRMKAMLFNKNNLEFSYPTNQLVGKNVNWVVEKLEDAGFNNCKPIAIKDIYPGIDKFVGEVEQVVVDGQSWVEADEPVLFDAEIIITFHTKKEFAFPYSKHKMMNMGYKTLADKLVDIGFTQIYVSKLEDLKTGFLKRENSVSDVVIDGVDTIKCGMMLEYDRKISIQYHTFPGR